MEEKKENQFSFVFGKVNYILMGIGLVMLALGYIQTRSLRIFG